MLRFITLITAALIAGACGCDVGPGPEGAIVETDPSARQVSVLLASISVTVGEDRLAAGHLVEARISVDGSHWGVFGFDAEPPADWTLDSEGEALLRASVQEDLTLQADGPTTVGGWAVFLDRALEAGDHVVRIDALTLRNGKGEEIEITSTTWMPFRIELGDGTAWIGDLSFTLDALP